MPVDVRSEIEIGRPPAPRLPAPLTAPAIRRANAKALHTLRELLEDRHA